MRLMHLRLIFTCFLTAGLACAQGPRIGTIDFYGLRKVTEAKVRKALAVSEGGVLPSSKADVEERMPAGGSITVQVGEADLHGV